MITKELIRTKYPAPSFTTTSKPPPAYGPDKPPCGIQTVSVTFGDLQLRTNTTFKKIKTLEAMKKFKAEAIQLRADISRARAERKAGV